MVGIVVFVLDEPGLYILPWLSFLILYGDFLFFTWPRSIPFRILFLLGVFSLLYFPFVVVDVAFGFEAKLVFAWGSIGINTVALGGMWYYWWHAHKRASFVRALILGMLLHCWLFGLGFLVLGKAETEISTLFFDLRGCQKTHFGERLSWA